MFYSHAIFIGGNSQKGSRYLSFPPGLSLSRPVDTKTDFNLNNVKATLSLISFSSVKVGRKTIRRQMSRHVLRLMNAKAGEYRRSELRGLDVTISARYHWSVARQLIPFPLSHRNLRNLTLQQECYLTNTRAFFRIRMAL